MDNFNQLLSNARKTWKGNGGYEAVADAMMGKKQETPEADQATPAANQAAPDLQEDKPAMVKGPNTGLPNNPVPAEPDNSRTKTQTRASRKGKNKESNVAKKSQRIKSSRMQDKDIPEELLRLREKAMIYRTERLGCVGMFKMDEGVRQIFNLFCRKYNLTMRSAASVILKEYMEANDPDLVRKASDL